MEKKFTVIDMFSGCGGFSYGFQQAGFQIVVGIDNSEIALKTFEINHTNSKVLLLDLHKDNSINKIVEEVRKTEIDVIIAGPPCQGFSLTGKRNQDDERNSLFLSVFKLAKKLKPKAIIIENVPGFLNLYNGKAKKEVIRLSAELGYTCNSKLLYAPDFGIPQIRKRAFLVALKKELGIFEFPEPLLNEENYIGCEDAIGDLPDLTEDLGHEIAEYDKKATSEYQKLMRKGSSVLRNHVGTQHTENVKNVISLVPEGGNHKDLPPGIGDSRRFNEAWTRYHSKKPSKTIDTGHRNHFHYKWNRIPSVRENARLQSFPDNFCFLGNKTEQYRQVGNAVPPLLGEVLGKQLIKYLTNEL